MARSRTSRISSSEIGRASRSTILMPLYSTGLWLAVMLTPPAVFRSIVAKYISGDVAWPMSVTSQPAAVAPSTKPAFNSGVCGRRSPPRTMLVPPWRRSQVPQACPMRRVTSGVRSVPAKPRMSYARNMCGLMVGAPSVTCVSLQCSALVT